MLDISNSTLLDQDVLSRYSIHLRNELKKDKKIDKKIDHRSLMWDFNAATGAFNRATYYITIKDKKDTYPHLLVHIADGSWFYASKTGHLFFDQADKASQPPAVVAPATAQEIQGLPNMAIPSMTVKLPRSADGKIEIVMEKGDWEQATFVYQSDKGNGTIDLYYNDDQQAYVPAYWDFGSEIMFYQNAGVNNNYAMGVQLLSYLGEYNSPLRCLWHSTPEQVSAYVSGQSEQLEGEIATSYLQNTAIGFDFGRAYSAGQYKENLTIEFSDYSTGMLTAVEQTYPAMTNP